MSAESLTYVPGVMLSLLSQRTADGRQRIFHASQLASATDGKRWHEVALRELRQRLDDENFPCPFAKKSNEIGNQWFIFVEGVSAEDLHHLALGLIEFAMLSRQTERGRKMLSPLVVLFQPDPEIRDLQSYHDRAWRILQKLHGYDQAAWPEHTPTNPEHHLWSFCYAGMQMFVNVSAPYQRERPSRNLGQGLVFIINPRENFDIVAGDNDAGHKVRALIRKRIAKYDGLPASEDLGTYGNLTNREWRQYIAGEANAPLPAACPLKIRSRPPLREA